MQGINVFNYRDHYSVLYWPHLWFVSFRSEIANFYGTTKHRPLLLKLEIALVIFFSVHIKNIFQNIDYRVSSSKFPELIDVINGGNIIRRQINIEQSIFERLFCSIFPQIKDMYF